MVLPVGWPARNREVSTTRLSDRSGIVAVTASTTSGGANERASANDGPDLEDGGATELPGCGLGGRDLTRRGQGHRGRAPRPELRQGRQGNRRLPGREHRLGRPSVRAA